MIRSGTTSAAAETSVPSAITRAVAFGEPLRAIDGIQRFGFGAAVALLFIIYSRIFDAYLSFLHLPTVAFLAVLAASALTGAFVRAFSHPIGKYLFAFTTWAILTIPFSMYRRGSYDVITQTWLKAMLAFVAVAGLTLSYNQCRRAANTIGYSILVVGLLLSTEGISTTGRLLMEGKYSNPNDLAQGILIGLPFVWLRMKNAKQGVAKVLFGLSAALLLLPLMKTGSRGGLIAFAVMGIVLFKQSPRKDKLKIVLAAGLVAIAGVVFLPRTLIQRYALILSDSAEQSDEDDMMDSANGSSQERRALLQRSLSLTLHHPIFGVGPGEFGEAAQAASPVHIPDQVTHNSYTQISSEMGIIAFVFYGAALVYCLTVTNRIRKFGLAQNQPVWAEVANTAMYLRLAIIAYAASAAFASVAYQAVFPALAGLVVALDLALQPEMKAAVRQNARSNTSLGPQINYRAPRVSKGFGPPNVRPAP